MTLSERRKRWRETKCADCKEPKLSGHSRCAKHLEAKREPPCSKCGQKRGVGRPGARAKSCDSCRTRRGKSLKSARERSPHFNPVLFVGGQSASARQRGKAPPPAFVPLNRQQRQAAGMSPTARPVPFLVKAPEKSIAPVFTRRSQTVGRPAPRPAAIPVRAESNVRSF